MSYFDFFSSEILLPHGSALFSKMAPMDPLRPFPPPTPTVPVNFTAPGPGMIAQNPSYQTFTPQMQSGLGQLGQIQGQGQGQKPVSHPYPGSLQSGPGSIQLGPGSATAGPGPPSFFPLPSAINSINSVNLNSNGPVSSSGIPSSHLNSQSQSQSQLLQSQGGQVRNNININNLSSSSSSNFVPSSSSFPTAPSQSQSQSHMISNQVVKSEAPAAIRVNEPPPPVSAEPPKKVMTGLSPLTTAYDTYCSFFNVYS